jgi:hypothetical protein
MDEKPFFIFNLADFKEPDVEQVKKFSKSVFDIDNIIDSASELKHRGLIKQYLNQQLVDPDENFVRLCLKGSGAYTGSLFQNIIDEFTPVVRGSFRSLINEQIDKRLKTALASEDTIHEIEQPEQEDTSEREVITTQEEMEAYLIVKSILREVTDSKRIAIRDSLSYCAILLDDNNRKTLCRLHFNTSQKYLGLIGADKNEERMPIDSLDDIFQHSDRLKATVGFYDNQ